MQYQEQEDIVLEEIDETTLENTAHSHVHLYPGYSESSNIPGSSEITQYEPAELVLAGSSDNASTVTGSTRCGSPTSRD